MIRDTIKLRGSSLILSGVALSVWTRPAFSLARAFLVVHALRWELRGSPRGRASASCPPPLLGREHFTPWALGCLRRPPAFPLRSALPQDSSLALQPPGLPQNLSYTSHLMQAPSILLVPHPPGSKLGHSWGSLHVCPVSQRPPALVA